MNREEIIRMAREAGVFEVSYPHPAGNMVEVERFANLVAAAEREACAGELEALRKANEKFEIRQEWWNDRMVALEAEVLAEREACAEICDDLSTHWDDDDDQWGRGYSACARRLASKIRARKIRARGEQK